MLIFYQNDPNKSVFISFFIYAFSLGTLFPRLADLQIQMEIDKATLGFALIGLPLGVQLTLLIADRIVQKIKFPIILIFGITVLSASLCFAAIFPNPIFFTGILVFGGAAIAIIEVAVNLEADRVEAKVGKRIMNRAHAFWSFGFFAAGIVGAGFSQLRISPFFHFLIVMLILSVLTYLLFSKYEAAKPRRKNKVIKKKSFVWPSKAIFMLVLFSISAMLVEGSSIDWSVIFMRDIFNTSPLVSGLSLALAAMAQGCVRYFADYFVNKFGSTRVSFQSLISMFIGVICVTFSLTPGMAIFGFLLMGAGSAVIFPLAISAAAQSSHKTPEENIASLSQFVFITFLLAPPILGFIGEYLGLRWSFALCLPFLLISFLTISSLDMQKNNE